MTHHRRFFTLAVACLLITALATTFGLGRLQAQGGPQAEKTAVAVLSLQDVLAQLNENAQFSEGMLARSEAFRTEFEQRQGAVQQMQNDLAMHAEGSEDYRDQEMRILNKLIESQTWQQFQEQMAQLDQRTHLASLYVKIIEAAEEIARQQGIDIVLLNTPVPNFDTLNPEQLLNIIGSRQVLFSVEEVDITRSVVEKMNTQWENR